MALLRAPEAIKSGVDPANRPARLEILGSAPKDSAFWADSSNNPPSRLLGALGPQGAMSSTPEARPIRMRKDTALMPLSRLAATAHDEGANAPTEHGAIDDRRALGGQK